MFFLESEVYAEDNLPCSRIATHIESLRTSGTGSCGLGVESGIRRNREEVVKRHEEAEVADEGLLGQALGQRVAELYLLELEV